MALVVDELEYTVRVPGPSTPVLRERPLESWFAILIPFWLFGLIFPPALDLEHREIAQVAVLLWPAPFFLLRSREYFIYGGTHRGSASVRILTWALVVEFLIGSIFSIDPILSLGYTLTAAAGLICCAGLWSCISWRMERALTFYAVLGSMFATYAVVRGDTLQGRLTFGHPNYLGLISFGILVCSLGVRVLAIRIPLVAINLYVIVQAQARACLLASIISILVYILLATRKIWARKTGVATFIVSLVALASAYMAYREEVSRNVSILLSLEDHYRGIGTGFTGRLEAWQEAYGLFLDRPILGIGFRSHEQLMTTLSSAHNGYLSILAETGICGLLLALALIAVCGVRLFRLALTADRVALVGSAFVAGYLFIAIFDRFLINFGSSTSVLMWIFLFMPRWPRPGNSDVSGDPRFGADAFVSRDSVDSNWPQEAAC